MSKVSDRRPLKVSEEAFADNWARIFGLSGRSSTAEQDSLTVSVVRSNRTAPANSVMSTIQENTGEKYGQAYIDNAPANQGVWHVFSTLAHLKTDFDLDEYVKACIQCYVDDATGKQVSEDWWPGQPHDA